MNKKILITGGAGYIGPVLVDKLSKAHFDIVVLDNLATGYKQNLPKNIKLIKKSILDKKLDGILKNEKPEIVFHLAALKSVKESLRNPLKFAEENVLGSLNLLDAMQKTGTKKMIFFSTSGIYGDFVPKGGQVETQPENPSSPYACSKLAIEKYIKYYNTIGLQGIVLRFANVYGNGGKSTLEGAVNKFTNFSKKGKEIVVDGDGRQTRDFVSIDDLTDLCIKIAKSNFRKVLKASMIYNVSTGKEISINTILKLLPNAKFRHDRGGTIGQKRSVLNPSLAKKIFNWEAKIDLKKGVKKII